MVCIGRRLRCRRLEAGVQAPELGEDEGEDEGEDGGNRNVYPCCCGTHARTRRTGSLLTV
jgi:hypothetical protein